MRVYAGALLIVLVCIGSLEVYWRTRDFAPMINDTPSHWAAVRQRANGAANSVVLVGSSRFQLGLDPTSLNEISREFHFYSLAVAGVSPLPILESLAKDEDFVGHVVVEFMPSRYVAENEASISAAQSYLGAYDGRSATLPYEQYLVNGLKSVFVTLHQQLNAREVIATIVRERDLPRPHYRRIHPDRYVEATFTPEVVAMEAARDRAKASAARSEPTYPFAPELIKTWVEAIRARGGTVTFFQINSDGTTLEAERTLYPRATVYERYRSVIDNARWIHFEDHEPLKRYKCPDGAHLDGRDRRNYAADFLAVLLPLRAN